MVAYRDGSVLAQLGTPDMRTPIAHALAWPERIEAGVNRLNLAHVKDLSFKEPDLERFPCLRLAFAAMKDRASTPVALNAANEVAVEAFLAGQIRFDGISALVERVLEQSDRNDIHDLDDVMQADVEARRMAMELMRRIS